MDMFILLHTSDLSIFPWLHMLSLNVEPWKTWTFPKVLRDFSQGPEFKTNLENNKVERNILHHKA